LGRGGRLVERDGKKLDRFESLTKAYSANGGESDVEARHRFKIASSREKRTKSATRNNALQQSPRPCTQESRPQLGFRTSQTNARGTGGFYEGDSRSWAR